MKLSQASYHKQVITSKLSQASYHNIVNKFTKSWVGE